MTVNHLDQLNFNLRRHLQSIMPAHSFSSIAEYAVFPPGKLFRPQLAAYFYEDLTNAPAPLAPDTPLSYWCSVLEIHHAYTLIHDDLPAMDDDATRRNKPSTHIQFGEALAILAGDALLAGSFELIAKCGRQHSPTLLQLTGRLLGARGLILGQVYDINQEMNLSFKHLERTHELKTGRLIQLALLGSSVLASDQKINVMNLKRAKEIFRLGKTVGILFQLLDDLEELYATSELTAHEREVNPFLQFPQEIYPAFEQLFASYTHLIKQLKPLKTYQYLAAFFKKHEEHARLHESTLTQRFEQHLPQQQQHQVNGQRLMQQLLSSLHGIQNIL